jgi:uncharacterized protein (TIGR00725 family)
MIIAVVGKGRNAPENVVDLALHVGGLIARAGHITLTGGLGGVMEAAARGSRLEKGVTLGIVPGEEAPNDYIDVCIRTGLDHAARNVVIAKTADAMIALAGSHGTLQEIAMALDRAIPLVQCETTDWSALAVEQRDRHHLAAWLRDLTLAVHAADVIVFDAVNKKVLLAKRPREPFEGLWALPGGKIAKGEDPRMAAGRELLEETGYIAPPAALTYFRKYDGFDRDPRGHAISHVFRVDSLALTHCRTGETATAWFAPDALPELAFDHAEIIADAIKLA